MERPNPWVAASRILWAKLWLLAGQSQAFKEMLMLATQPFSGNRARRWIGTCRFVTAVAPASLLFRRSYFSLASQQTQMRSFENPSAHFKEEFVQGDVFSRPSGSLQHPLA